MKTKEELAILKDECVTLSKKLSELTDEELKIVAGGTLPSLADDEKYIIINGSANMGNRTPSFKIEE